LFAAGAQAAGAVSAQALALAVGGLKTMSVTKVKLLGIVLASMGVLAGGGAALRGPGGAWTTAPQAAAAEPDILVGQLVTDRDAGPPVSAATLAELKKLQQSSDPEVRRSAAALLKRLQAQPDQAKRFLSVSVDLGNGGANEGWVLVNGGKDGKIVLRPAGEVKPGDTTRELIVYKKDGQWVVEEVLGLKADVRQRWGKYRVELDVPGTPTPQAKLADLEKKMRSLSEELEALRRQMKQAPQKH
jgi:hypothetical protein